MREKCAAALHFRLSFFHWQFSVVFATVQEYELRKPLSPSSCQKAVLKTAKEDRKANNIWRPPTGRIWTMCKKGPCSCLLEGQTELFKTLAKQIRTQPPPKKRSFLNGFHIYKRVSKVFRKQIFQFIVRYTVFENHFESLS